MRMAFTICLLRLGDLSEEEIAARCESPGSSRHDRRIGRMRGEPCAFASRANSRYVPVEYAARYRDALGTPLPPGLPEFFWQPTRQIRCAKLCAAMRAPMGRSPRRKLRRATACRRASRSRTARATRRRENCWKANFVRAAGIRNGAIPEVLQQIRRKSLARLRREVEPVEQSTFARFTGALARCYRYRAAAWTRCWTR